MQFDKNNNVVKLCAQGMDMEGKGNPEEANNLFLQAWNEATTDFEKFTAAHYVARHQKSVADKLKKAFFCSHKIYYKFFLFNF